MSLSLNTSMNSHFAALPEQGADSHFDSANDYSHSRPRRARSVEPQAVSTDERPYAGVSDRQLIGLIRDHFREYAAGATDSYVNFNELKEAAGLIETERTFSPEAHHAARELLLWRPVLLRKLDIGISFFGGPGKEDKRFDMDNLDYLYKFPHREWKVPRRNH